MKKLIIFSDLDGTIFPDNKIMLPETISDIKWFQDQGYEFVISTGNPYIDNVPAIAKELNVRYCITSNGASIFDTHKNEYIYLSKIPMNKANKIINFSLDNKIGTDWWDASKIFVNDFLHHEAKQALINSVSKNALFNKSSKTSNDILKIEFYDDKSKIDASLDFLKDLDLQVVRMKDNHVEITHNDVSKGEAVLWLLNHLHIPVEDAMAVGDSANDLSMFKVLKHTYAMENAHKEIKEKTLHTTGHMDSNGIGDSIKHFVNKKNNT